MTDLWGITMLAVLLRSCRFAIILALTVACGIAHAEPEEVALARADAARDPLSAAIVATLPFTTQAIVPQESLRPSSFNRRRYLESLVPLVTAGARSPEEIAVKWTAWLQRHIAHPKWPPMHDAATMVLDPVWIIENRIAHCGQTNRVLVAGLKLAGIEARLIQLAAHVAAEAYWDGAWHYLDADWLHDGETVRWEDGVIPSAEEIAGNLHWLDRLHPSSEFETYPVDISHNPEILGAPVAEYKRMFDHSPAAGRRTPFAWSDEEAHLTWVSTTQ